MSVYVSQDHWLKIKAFTEYNLSSNPKRFFLVENTAETLSAAALIFLSLPHYKFPFVCLSKFTLNWYHTGQAHYRNKNVSFEMDLDLKKTFSLLHPPVNSKPKTNLLHTWDAVNWSGCLVFSNGSLHCEAFSTEYEQLGQSFKNQEKNRR